VAACSVVIVNFNAGPHLREAVTSALESPLVMDVIVVDNGSTDGSLTLLPQVRNLSVIRNGANLGFAAACNIGIEQSSSEFVLLLNPDCRVEGDAIERLIAVLRGRPDAGMAGPLLLNPDGSEQAGGRRIFPTPRHAVVRVLNLQRLSNLFPGLFGDYLLHVTPLPSEPTEVEAISGACMLVRRTALDHVGLLDEGYFMHTEDLDWCMEFFRKGWKIVFVPDARVFHDKGISSRPRQIFVEFHKHKSILRFYRKQFSDRYNVVQFAVLTAAVWSRFSVLAIRMKLASIISRFRSGKTGHAPHAPGFSDGRVKPEIEAVPDRNGIPVGVLGGTSMIADYLPTLLGQDYSVIKFSRKDDGLAPRDGPAPRHIPLWISLMPIYALPDYFTMLSGYDLRRIVCLSSTSVFTKTQSSDPAETTLVAQFVESERRLIAWAEANNIEWVILRPTLVYGGGRDLNVSEIARFIGRFGFFPLLGAGKGLRQPVHAQDVAFACCRALTGKACANRAYNISGGETLTYRDMVSRIFAGLGRVPRILTVPYWAFAVAVRAAKILPRFRALSPAMARRMNQDMVFDHAEAAEDLGFRPRPFRPGRDDLPF